MAKNNTKSGTPAQVSFIMGSSSDLSVMEEGPNWLKKWAPEVGVEVSIVSAHRTPEQMVQFAKEAPKRGIQVIIAGAGGAAHLPGMVASLTTLPVIGVPIRSRNSMEGQDSLLSIVQMPKGVPVATVALDGAVNAAILAAQILALNDEKLALALKQYKEFLNSLVGEQNQQLLNKL